MAYRKKRVNDVQRQWVSQKVVAPVSTQEPHFEVAILADPGAGTISYPVRLCRVFLTVSIQVFNMQATNAYNNWFYLGLCRADPALNKQTMKPFDNSTADRSWLYRQCYRLPTPAPASAASGLVDLNGEPYQLDWPLRGGKGTALDRDIELRLVGDLEAFSGSATVDIVTLQLWESE